MRQLLLHIPRLCHEQWDAMTPTSAGRHCAACQKAVVDFTAMTDGQLRAFLAQGSGPACGRFRPDQVGRPLYPAAPVSRWRAWLASALALGGVLGAGRTAAQSRSNYAGPLPEAVSAPASAPPVVIPAQPLAAVAPAAATTTGPLTVSGVVLDAENRQPLPGVDVMIKGTSLGTSTNSDGQFNLTSASPADSLRLAFHFIGYTVQETTVIPGSQPLAVRLAPDLRMLGEVVAVGSYYVRQPWPWHPRALYGWTRYQMGRLLGRY